MMETKDMFARRREKIDLFKAFRNKKVTVQEKSVPDDLYTKCPSCGQPILSRKYRELLRVCPHCGAHGVLGVRDRLTATVDEGSFRELFGNVRSRDPLDFPGYAEKLSALEQKTGKRIRLWDFKKELARTMEILQMDPSYAERDLNVGFSGGEKKKAEILQLLMLKPSLAILDETDSGLDVDAVRTVSRGIEEYQKNCDGGLLIITHSTRILEYLSVDDTHVMVEGKIVKTGDASLVDEINEKGLKEVTL